jgi:histidyl-tRNA synthetase
MSGKNKSIKVEKTKSTPLSTQPYKGVRDFYPEDMAVQMYLFDVWSMTAESFGFERYDASVLEPANLYKAKGAENEEMVNEQTYTFTDRGDREVTLRPEMTPTVARMIAGKRQTLSFPVRWYSIPNLFRYERTQRGRLREHWQLNCDIFGSTDYTADIEVIALAHQIFMNFGADESMFEIRVNNRQTMKTAYEMLGITDSDTVTAITRLNDRKAKIDAVEYLTELENITKDKSLAKEIKAMIETKDAGDNAVVAGLQELGIGNVVLDRSLARGFDYYTGTVFEIFDTNPENNRSMMGGGRYDNLTALFGGEPISGIGFGFGDVTLRNFLESHNLLTANLTAPTMMVIPTGVNLNLEAQKIAKRFREAGISVASDISTKKLAKKISGAGEQFVQFVIIFGENELSSNAYTLKDLNTGEETKGSIEELTAKLTE